MRKLFLLELFLMHSAQSHTWHISFHAKPNEYALWQIDYTLYIREVMSSRAKSINFYVGYVKIGSTSSYLENIII